MHSRDFVMVFLYLVFIVLSIQANGQNSDLNFMTVAEDSAIPHDDLMEYQVGPHVLRYQVVRIDAQLLREFLYRDSQNTDQTDSAPMRLTLFDEEPVEYFREISQISNQGEATGFAGWVGLTKGDVPYSVQVVISPRNAVSVHLTSDVGQFQVTATDALPYHVLWQWNPEFTNTPVKNVDDAL